MESAQQEQFSIIRQASTAISCLHFMAEFVMIKGWQQKKAAATISSFAGENIVSFVRGIIHNYPQFSSVFVIITIFLYIIISVYNALLPGIGPR